MIRPLLQRVLVHKLVKQNKHVWILVYAGWEGLRYHRSISLHIDEFLAQNKNN